MAPDHPSTTLSERHPATELSVMRFWQEHPCGEDQIGGLDRFDGDYDRFFIEYDRFRYSNERHLPSCLAALNVSGTRLLEIGLGEGSDSELLIRQGAKWSGIDLTAESVARVKNRLTLRNLPYTEIRQGSVLDLPFSDGSFDVVFSHGVLHHVPDIRLAQKEIHRVLSPNGELVTMVYARRSVNYLICIAMIRRAALLAAYLLARAGLAIGGACGGVLADHLANARRVGLFRYLRLAEFIHHNTDGPANPYSAVYDKRRIEQDFPAFRVTKIYKRFMHAPPLPLHKFPGESLGGWHLWVHLRPT